MSSNDPSLISGLDPAGLFALADDATIAASGEWQPPSLEEVAALFPAWKVLGLLGRGGMGAVYRFHQPDLDRDVAVKLLPIEASRNERQVERFRREARTLAKLRHPGIVALHEAGISPAGHFFFVMEFVDGCPLSEMITSGKVDVTKAIEIVRQVCDALAYAHAAGVVHRDIKPSNILIDQQGHANVADFGLARWEQSVPEGALHLSQTGMFMGTPAYTAPEQARDAAHADHRADLYSLGVLLYEMLTGELPRGVFQPPSTKSGSDARLDNVVQRALQERPEDRYQAAAELKQDVTSAQSKTAAPKRLSSVWLWISVAAMGLLVLAVSLELERNFATGQRLLSEISTRAPSRPLTPSGPSKDADGQTERATPSSIPKPEGASPSAESRQPPASAIPQPNPEPMKVAKASPATPAEPIPVPLKPSKPAAAPAVPPSPQPKVIKEPTAQAWSIEPVSPALHPPAELLQTPWKDAVLLYYGGAVLLEDSRTIATWREGLPGKMQQTTHTEPITTLSSTPDDVVFLDTSGGAFRISLDDPTKPVPVANEVRAIFTSGSSEWICGITKEGKAMLWRKGSSASPIVLPFTDISQLTITSDQNIYAVDGSKQLLHLTGPEGKTIQRNEHENISKIEPSRQSLIMLTEDRKIIVLGALSAATPALEQITDIFACEDFALAVDPTSRATLWGPSVQDSPQRFRLPQGKTHLRVSPRGLLVAW